MPHLRFREDKTTQAAARLLKRGGGRMPYLSLVKLLYFADRKALAQLGRPISYDLFVSMPHGPVLSRTLDLITSEPDPDKPSYWREHISAPEAYDVKLVKEPVGDRLSPAEEAILDEVYRKLGNLDRWRLRDLSHQLPEWIDPQGSSVPIDIRDILVHQGITEEGAKAIIQDLVAEDSAESLAD
jgi:uncharacterized phage-associated protein